MDSNLLLAVYNIADIFVMPNIPVDNDLEGFGIVALESCASGKPVIASKVDGIPDAIKNGENGILIQHSDYLYFSEKILELLENHGAYREISQKCKQYVAEHYSWEKIASQYWNIFNALVEQKNRH
jgi:glycosyltransferase involved in cell wall biosynthesis